MSKHRNHSATANRDSQAALREAGVMLADANRPIEMTPPAVVPLLPRRTSLADAIEVAEARTAGRAFEGQLRTKTALPYFAIGVAKDTRLLLVGIDAASNSVRSVTLSGLVSRLEDRHDRDQVSAVQLAAVAPARAARVAEAFLGGRAIAIESILIYDRHAYEVTVLRHDRKHSVRVDMNTGDLVRPWS